MYCSRARNTELDFRPLRKHRARRWRLSDYMFTRRLKPWRWWSSMADGLIADPQGFGRHHSIYIWMTSGDPG
jgi:hypothetical protein